MKGAEKVRDYSKGEGEQYRRPDGSEFGIRNSKQNVTPDSSSNQQLQNNTNNLPKYDDQTDLNKVGSGLIKSGIIGGVGAITGITTGTGNIAIDATTGAITGLTMRPPAIKKKPDLKAKTTPTQAGDKTRL